MSRGYYHRYFILITFILVFQPLRNVFADDNFAASFLENINTKDIDLSAFNQGEQLPGVYHVNVYVNENKVSSQDIAFNKDANGKLKPCLDLAQLSAWGVKVEEYPGLQVSGDKCINITAIPQASYTFLFNVQKLDLSIPQAAMANHARGYVAPELWDEGINALFLSYDMSGDSEWNDNSADRQRKDRQFANLQPGLNMGAWRLRNFSSWGHDPDSGSTWDSAYSYLQRDIPRWESLLTLGENFTAADVFDSAPFTGIELASDDYMRPDSQRGYAPVVRGIARSNAQVTVKQNNYIVYQSYVAAGPFEISDLLATGSAGDLYVSVKEQDGSEQVFVVPFASVPILQREGVLKYDITSGRYRAYDNGTEDTPFTQISASYGLPKGFTVYGGGQFASKYQSLAVGSGINMGGLGAASVDVTQGWATPKLTNADDEQNNASLADSRKRDGQYWRMRYSKSVPETGSTLTAAYYRASSSGFMTMTDVLDSYNSDYTSPAFRRSRVEAAFSQKIGWELGSISASLTREKFWDDEDMDSWQLTWSNTLYSINYNLSYSYSKNSWSDDHSQRYQKDEILAFSLSIPLERFLPGSRVTYNMTSPKGEGANHSVDLSGQALENNALTWSVGQSYNAEEKQYGGNLNTSYDGTYGSLNGGYDYDPDNKRLHYGLSGSLVAHKDGLTLAQSLGETNVLIKAPGAAGVGVNDFGGIKTDMRGYTIVNWVNPYRINELNLNTRALPENVELETANQTVIPTRGALVRAEFITHIGDKVLLTLTQKNGQPVPFGAIATVEGDDKSQGVIVGDNGVAYLSGMQPDMVLKVQWGANITCRATYHQPVEKGNHQIISAREVCQ